MGLDAGYGIESVKTGVCTSTTRPASPYIGQHIFETDTSLWKVYLAGGWSTGIKQSINLPVEYLVIAGGGAGGSGYGAGGGAGGYRCSVAGESSGGGASAESALSLVAGTYTVTVGAGGSSANGSNSVFSTITSIGGGAGGAIRLG